MTLVIVMGVSGCGKSSVAQSLAERLDLPFIEGDALHPATNVAKMSAGLPLSDADRWPWLQKIGVELRQLRQSGGAVATCSALKRAYRDALREAAGPDLIFVHMSGSRALLEERMKKRKGHFMPAALLDSQLATLEIPDAEENAITIDCAEPLEAAVAHAEALICARQKEVHP